MSDEKSVLFRVTRARTTIFHPDRAVSLRPIQTGEEIELPESVAKYHARNGVGEIVTAEEPEAEPEGPKTEEPKVEEPKAEEPKAPVKRGPGRPAAAK